MKKEFERQARGRVLFVIPRWQSFRCFFRELALALRQEGWEVHCAAGVGTGASGKIPGGDYFSEAVKFHRVEIPRGMNLPRQVQAALELRGIVAEVNPHWVHAQFASAIFCVALARESFWPPVYGTFHGLGYPLRGGFLGWILRFAECWAASRMNRVLVLTEDDRRLLSGDLGGRSVDVLASAGLGCDLESFDPGTVDRLEVEHWRTVWRLDEEQCVFGFVGRWTEFKGFGCLARAFLEVSKECREARLLLVGEPDELHPDGLTPEERGRLRGHPAVCWAGQRQHTAPMLALMDALVFPSRREGVPVSVMEALAMGVPVLAWNVRGSRDVVRGGVDGELLAASNVVEGVQRLAERMVVWCRQLELRRKYAVGAWKGRGRLSRAQYVREQMRFYEEESVCT